MTLKAGIYQLSDLYEQRFAPISTLDTSKILATIQAYGDFLVRDMDEQLSDFTEETAKSRAIWGGAPTLSFDEVNEYGKGQPKKEVLGQELHFPLFKLSATDQRTAEVQKRMSVGQFRELLLAMNNAYAARVRNEIQAAIFNKNLHTKVNDWTVDNSVLNKVQPFLNADGAEIPIAPNGTSFTSTAQNHYLGVTGATVAVADVNYLLAHVREHLVGKINLYVDANMPATLAALSSTPFVYNQYTNVIDQTAAKIGATANRDGGQSDRANMFIGTWDGHEVHTRSWCPTGYLAAIAVNSPLGKPLLRRIDPAFPGMRISAELTDNTVVLKEAYTYLGFAAFNRAAGACLDTTTQASYTNPTLTRI